LLAGAWVGCDDREFRFRQQSLGQGASAALPIWAFFMKRVYADRKTGISQNASFKAPAGYSGCEVVDSMLIDYSTDPSKRNMKGQEIPEEVEETFTPATQDYE
jgi:membrane carboxypeptidase/penicillin-binding protein